MNIFDRVVFHTTYDGGPLPDTKYTYIGEGRFEDERWSLEVADGFFKNTSVKAVHEVVFNTVEHCKELMSYIDKKDPDYLSSIFDKIGKENDFYKNSVTWWKKTIIGSDKSLWSFVSKCITENHLLRRDLCSFEIPLDVSQKPQVRA